MNNEILKELLAQEDELQLHHFNNATAWELGNLIRLGAEKISASVSIEVYAFEQVVFSYAMPGTSKDQQDWIRRKRQAVIRFGNSSYYLGQYNASKNREFETIPYVDPKEYCAHGGSFPIRIKNGGIIGAVTVSGLPQETDHQLAVDAMRDIVRQQTK
ncbi:heme-degrading domain-containing protein [Cellvibrio sp. UBA7661]|uniref:heme-degrading domain-containing protein n=1 Tax=Cellvibrio sp. UBA7661 TaxID=1946311 RepID=UPI002F35D115